MIMKKTQINNYKKYGIIEKAQYNNRVLKIILRNKHTTKITSSALIE